MQRRGVSLELLTKRCHIDCVSTHQHEGTTSRLREIRCPTLVVAASNHQ
jgi:hypothetical protein